MQAVGCTATAEWWYNYDGFVTVWLTACSAMPNPAEARAFGWQREITGNFVRVGIYRTVLEGIGECARVDMRVGDAAPYLERAMYELLGFEPRFESLPYKADGWPREKQRIGL